MVGIRWFDGRIDAFCGISLSIVCSELLVGFGALWTFLRLPLGNGHGSCGEMLEPK